MGELEGTTGERTDIELLAQVSGIVVAQGLGEVLGGKGVIASCRRAAGGAKAVFDGDGLRKERAGGGERLIDHRLRHAMSGDFEEADALAGLGDGAGDGGFSLLAAGEILRQVDDGHGIAHREAPSLSWGATDAAPSRDEVTDIGHVRDALESAPGVRRSMAPARFSQCDKLCLKHAARKWLIALAQDALAGDPL